MSTAASSPSRHRELGLTDHEYELILERLGREPNQVELNIGVPRILALIGQREEALRLESYFRPRAAAALKVLERHLAQQQWLVGAHYSVADLALCAYVQLAPQAGHDLSQFPAISAWLSRLRAQPRFLPLD